MASQNVDLVYELQVELNWDKVFASSACKEYQRWLQLRAKTGDFQTCKLPPSRVVAMVWNVHRQWTIDYEKTCTSLGGFIHHHPPAMRMGYSREQGYAVTLQTYKSHFKEDPPPVYWEPLICPSRHILGSRGPATQPAEISGDARLTLIDSASQPSVTKTDDDLPNQDVEISRTLNSSGFPRLRRRGASASRQSPWVLNAKGFDQAEDGSADYPGYRVAIGTGLEPISLAQEVMLSHNVYATQRADEQRNELSKDATIKDVDEKELRLKRSHRGGNKARQGYVLKPLAPGERRRRGRPSLSEYIPFSELADSEERESVSTSEDKEDVEKSHFGQSTRRSKSAPATQKGRKDGPLKHQARTFGARPSREANGNRLKSSRSMKQDGLLKQRTRATGLGNDSKINKVKKSRQQTTGGRIGPDGNPLRRPRGRPRKDGSWPVPRSKRQQAPQSISRRQAQSGVAATSQSEQTIVGKEVGCLPTTLVPDTNIESADVALQTLETDVGANIMEPMMPESDGTQAQGAVSERDKRMRCKE